MLTLLITLALMAGGYLLLSKQASVFVWTISYAVISLLFLEYSSIGWFGSLCLFLGFIVLAIGAIRPLRQQLLSKHVLSLFRASMPKMSATEREALEAGTVSWEGDIFSGAPDFDKLLKEPGFRLTPDEQAFMDGPLNQLCRMINDWDITHNRYDMPEDVWEFIKKERFFGMIIPKEYGGLGFSASAIAMVLSTLYTCSITVASTVSVPNSLGPGELLLKYGTKKQRDYYLPLLAVGTEVPCFALTGPEAGSDAASIPDQGIVCKREFEGKETLGISLTWNKRYITLCPVATVMGLAFRLFDPENLLEKGVDRGITCALIPMTTPGVIRGRRHFPLNIVFMNGPTQGKDVFIPIDYVIGGAEQVGHGWSMLMECLSAGRAVSLPSSGAGGTQAATLASGGYSRVRKQFNQPIAMFEGIEEPLARIVGNNYLVNAGLRLAVSAIDNGAKPAVAGAIVKYQCVERGRRVITDAMDIHGGKGICLGPKNYLARGYEGAPIGITVEGANILTRSLIIFGQGAIRCHPYVFKEMESARGGNLVAFDEAFWGHVGFVLANFTKSLLFTVTDARFTHAPNSRAKRYYQLIHRYSSNLAFTADFCMILLGGELKRREKISARLGDVLSDLYLASAVLKRYHDEGEPEADLPVVKWCCLQLLHEAEYALRGVISNFPVRWARPILKIVLQPLGGSRHMPSDGLGKKIAKLITTPTETRERLTSWVFKENIPNCPLGSVEDAFKKVCAAESIEKQVAKAVRDKELSGLTLTEQIEEALQKGILTSAEAKQLQEAHDARLAVIAVDDFSSAELKGRKEPVRRKRKTADDFVSPLA